MIAPRKGLRLALPRSAPPLRDLSSCTAYEHNAELRARWEAAVTWLRSRPRGSLWLLDNNAGRTT